jgi:hypothetical protein
MNFNCSGFQYGQNIPINRTNNEFPFPLEQISDLNTNAIVLLTVYPHPELIQQSDIDQLATQMQAMTNTSRPFQVALRFAPEMNGNWKEYGMKPSAYRALWTRIYQGVKQVAPTVSFVWAPNYSPFYPFSFQGPNTPEDLALLDTNGNGQVDMGDDPYAPFYPGDEYVDWVGLSIYWKGEGRPNTIPPPGRFINYVNSGNFYQTYSALKNKPFMIAEGSSGWFPTFPIFTTELEMKQAWWRQSITDPTIYTTFPNLKLVSQFEYRKIEDPVPNAGPPPLTDFRITNDTGILNAFLSDFEAVKSVFLEAQYVAPVVQGPSGVSPSTPSTNNRNSALGLSLGSLFYLVFLLF